MRAQIQSHMDCEKLGFQKCKLLLLAIVAICMRGFSFHLSHPRGLIPAIQWLFTWDGDSVYRKPKPRPVLVFAAVFEDSFNHCNPSLLLQILRSRIVGGTLYKRENDFLRVHLHSLRFEGEKCLFSSSFKTTNQTFFKLLFLHSRSFLELSQIVYM